MDKCTKPDSELLALGTAHRNKRRPDGWLYCCPKPLAPPLSSRRSITRARLTFWWGSDGEPASRVQLTLEPTEHGTTRLRIIETRPLEILDLVGVPLPGGGARYGPALVAA